MSAKKRAERNVPHLENRPLVMGRDVSTLPQIMPDIPGMTVLKFWESVWQFNERNSGQVLDAQTARRPRNPNRAGAASKFGVPLPRVRPSAKGAPARAAASSALASNFRDGNSDRPATGTSCKTQVAFDNK